MYTQFAATIGHVYLFIPFMVTAIYLSLVNFDFALLETAKINGAGPFRAFVEVTWPLNWIGTAIGIVLVFIPCLASTVTPRFLGGPNATSFGMSLAQQFGETGTWALGSAMSVVLFIFSFLVIAIMSLHHQPAAQRLHRGRQIMIGVTDRAAKMAAQAHGGAAQPALCLSLRADPLRDLRLVLRRTSSGPFRRPSPRRPMPIWSATRSIPMP